MTVVMQSSESAQIDGSVINSSAAGLPRALLHLLRQASLKRLGRTLDNLRRNQARLAFHHLSHACKRHERVGIHERIDYSHSLLSEQYEEKIAMLRREWKDERQKLLETHGHVEADHIAVSEEDVQKLQALDKLYRDKLSMLKQDHLRSSNILSDECRELHKDSHLQTMALLALGPQSRHSRRTWRQDDMNTAALQWVFTRPPDPCMVPFPQAVLMEEQQHALANIFRLILEYEDKVPRWCQLASVNRGRPPKRPAHAAAAQLLKSLLRRLQEKCALRPAFRSITELPPLSPRRKSRLASLEPTLGRQAWDRVRSAVPRIRELSPAPPAGEVRVECKPIKKTRNRRKSVHILHVENPKRERAPRNVYSDDSQDHSRRSSSGSPPPSEEAPRGSRKSTFHLGDDYSVARDRGHRHPYTTPRARAGGAATVDTVVARHEGASPDMLRWADDTPAASSGHGRTNRGKNRRDPAANELTGASLPDQPLSASLLARAGLDVDPTPEGSSASRSSEGHMVVEQKASAISKTSRPSLRGAHLPNSASEVPPPPANLPAAVVAVEAVEAARDLPVEPALGAAHEPAAATGVASDSSSTSSSSSESEH